MVLAPTYGSPFVRDLAGGRRYGTLEDFQNFVKLTYAHAVAAPLGRHGVRADRRAGQQAPPRHGVRPPPLQRQGVHGLGHRARAGGRLRSRWPASCSAPTSSTSNCVILGNVNVNSPLVWDATMTGALQDLRPRQPGTGGRAVHPRRGDGPGHHGRRGRAGARRDHGGRRARPARARPAPPPSTATSCRRWRCAAAAPRSARPSRRSVRSSSGSWPAGSACPLRCSGAFTSSKVPDGQAMHGERGVDDGGAAVRRELHPPLRRLARGRPGDGLREVHDGPRPLRRGAHLSEGHRSLDDDQFALDGFAEVGPGKHFFGSQHTLRHYETAFYDPSLSDNNELRAVARRRLARHRVRAPRAMRQDVSPTTRRRPSTTRSTRRCGSSSPAARRRCRTSGTDGVPPMSDDPLLQPFQLKHLTLQATG